MADSAIQIETDTAAHVLSTFAERGYWIEYKRWKVLGDVQAFVTLPNGWSLSILVGPGSESSNYGSAFRYHSRWRWFSATTMEVGVRDPFDCVHRVHGNQSAEDVLAIADKVALYSPAKGVAAAIRAVYRALR